MAHCELGWKMVFGWHFISISKLEFVRQLLNPKQRPSDNGIGRDTDLVHNAFETWQCILAENWIAELFIQAGNCEPFVMNRDVTTLEPSYIFRVFPLESASTAQQTVRVRSAFVIVALSFAHHASLFWQRYKGRVQARRSNFYRVLPRTQAHCVSERS